MILENNIKIRNELTKLLDFIGHSYHCIESTQTITTTNLSYKSSIVILGEPYNNQDKLDVRELDWLYYVKNLNCSHCLLIINKSYNESMVSTSVTRMVSKHLKWPCGYYEFIGALSYNTSVSQSTLSVDDLKVQKNSGFIGKHPDILRINHMIQQVSKTQAPVLLQGESGTGKEIIAKEIHSRSQRIGPFIAINCGAIPSELLESELFGHEKGAFTGAMIKRIGKFERAKAGTLFLDEIGDMPIDMQVKLLRVLQEKVFERVGGSKLINTDIRIIAATNSDLQQKIKSNIFREDLYYRLNVFPIHIIPLRERPEDISLLIADYLSQMCKKEKHSIHFSQEASSCLLDYNWPGNVRELYNLLEQLLILYPNNTIKLDNLPLHYRNDCDVVSNTKGIESYLIEKALLHSQGKDTRAINYLKSAANKLIERVTNKDSLEKIKSDDITDYKK